MRRPVRAFSACIATVLAALATSAGAATIWPAATTPPQINTTTDSAAGWLPSDEQIAGVRKTAEDYLAAEDSGRPSEAYALFADLHRQHFPFAEFSKTILKFNAQAGPVKERRIVTVTWTKDPAQSPAPGVYAALDLVSRFANVDRHCGFLILYQPPFGGAFGIMREESNFLDNATARSVEKQRSQAAVDAAWSQLSAHCPNYAAPAPPIPEQGKSTIGYPTVAAALGGLHSKAGVVFSTKNGWTIAEEATPFTLWSFAPSTDPAYPAVAKRQVVSDGAGSDIQMEILCEASKAACDNLVRQFDQMNAKIGASASHH